MTAVTQYQRLESTGLWRDRPEAQRREVLVSLGDATLVISTIAESALSHWSLPAVHRLNPGKRPALYAPADDADETLEIAEPEMIAAIEKVRGAIETARPHPGRLRFGLTALIALIVAAFAVFWLPGALTRQTAALLPEAKRAEIGRRMLGEMATLSGRPCATEAGTAALQRLGRRTLGPDSPRIVVLPRVIAATAHLPGDIVIVDAGLVEDYETPEVLAGYLLAEAERMDATDPVRELLERAGLMATFKLLTTGAMPTARLHEDATRRLTERHDRPEDEAMLARFDAAGISSQPYAYALDVTGETVLGLIEADPMRGRLRNPLITDGDWIALQEICGS
ncbi:hypothetical protein HKCCE3408_11605 [Rhodobacterales bacterium HKCCE3408]|nr:hypothetical protein [Rhodobacterales bacterium HKCCE3408]